MAAKQPVSEKFRVALVNISGNVGKSTIASHVYKDQVLDMVVIGIEVQNTQIGSVDKIMSMNPFDLLYTEILRHESLCLDVGASSSVAFLDALNKYPLLRQSFSYIVVPTTPDLKQQADTIKTVTILRKIGFLPEQIHVVFNLFKPETGTVTTAYRSLLANLSNEDCTLNQKAVLYFDEIFARESLGSIREHAQATTDYPSLLKSAVGEDKDQLILQQYFHETAKNAHRGLVALKNIIHQSSP